jgi:hypothetical protein
MFHTPSHSGARFPSHPQVEDQARIVGGQATELGGGHLVIPQKFLDGAYQHATPRPVRLVWGDRGIKLASEILLV